MKNAIILCSGGIDSTTTAHYVRKKLDYGKLIILFFDYGQKSILMEKKFSKNCARELKAKFEEVRLNWLNKISTSLINKKGKAKTLTKRDLKNTKKESDKFYVPCRNTIFLSYALALADSLFIKEKKVYDIFVGFKCEGAESYPDTTQEFVKQMNAVGKIGCSRKFRIFAPLIRKDKEDIILIGKKLGVDFSKTVSCYVGRTKPCGSCLACQLRKAGFYWAGVEDETEYETKPDTLPCHKKP